MKYVVLYESGDQVDTLAPVHFAAHRAWYEQFRRRGELLMIGPFTDRAGALAVFTTRAAAEKFVSGDPFVHGGVIRGWVIRGWDEALVPVPEPEAAQPAEGV